MYEVSETEAPATWPLLYSREANIPQLLGRFAECTNRHIENADWMKVRNCFEGVMMYYRKADSFVKGLVENVYVYALRIDLSAELFRHCRGLMPSDLELLYHKLHFNDHP